MITKHKGFFVLCLILAVLCCFLGKWQLQRYEFKKRLLNNYTERLHAAPKIFPQLLAIEKDLQFQPIKAQGVYLNDLTLFQQKLSEQGQPGYEILTPLRIKNEKKLLLIDRGWVPETCPVTIDTQQQQIITGNIKLLNEYQFILGKNILKSEQGVTVIQRVDMRDISELTHQEFFPFIIVLDRQPPTTVLPERHMAYAVQWFLFALIIIVSFYFFARERGRDEL
ncbi:hypothetical protein AYO45_07010 [Gammaproteobacteria bacterium SCGC AG-212-F23]|nr:hypothetical protein AYO45_07010 [Gammaproteobacteria bacterium SCGC AG-212-F23]